VIANGKSAQHFLIIIAVIVIFIVFILGSPASRRWIKPRLVYLHPRRVFAAMLIFGAALMLNGVVIALLVNGLWRTEVALPWYRFSWGYSLAWLAGFIVPGAPGGIGIREAVFIALFGRELGEGTAAGLAVLLRVITSVGDVMTFGIAYVLGRKWPSG
jgi:uncharacterized membrane protein YbhN (UPF0104 family)